ncbi:hypothetical protein V490_00032, partial [Pseudogymnoascus sp. VKM F-3557]
MRRTPALSIVFYMAAASELDKIHVNPINEGLGAFRRLFESTRAELSVGASQDAVQVVFSTVATAVAKNLVLDLILALQNHRNVRTLPSQNGRANLLEDLFTLGSSVYSNDFDIRSAIPLVERVVNNAPDEEICSAVSDLVAHAGPKQITPPTAFENSVYDTPLRSSSASQRGIEQTHDEVDQRILEELTGRVYYDVGKFFERYFEGKVWTNNTKDIYENSRHQYAEGRWIGWPEPSAQGPFFEWFMKFQDTVLSGLDRRYYTSANKVLRGSEADRKLDIFLTPANVALLNGEHDWSNVLVIGEHKQNPDEDGSTKTLLQLAGYAREVFGSQPDRRFVPGFTICGSVMRLWVFDRSGGQATRGRCLEVNRIGDSSGPYSSEKFDIHKEPERFVRVITGYALMTDAELGLNTFIRRDGNKYIVAQGLGICLEDKPLAWQRAI